MIYLDNAATSFPKPYAVAAAVNESVAKYGANPGRSGHKLAQVCSDKLYECRKTVGDFFGQNDPEKVIFTPGCTYSINTVLKGILRPGDHIIISDMEHNAVVRPLNSLEKKGISVSRAVVVEGDSEATLKNFKSCIRKNTRMIFTTQASNVFGVVVPIKEIAKLCEERGILFGVDAAQSAGHIDIDMSKIKIDFLCVPAHKGLFGIMGQGALLLGGDNIPLPVIEGGTGSFSKLRSQPAELPDRLESGTLNMSGICAMAAGIDYINEIGKERITFHELALARRLYDRLQRIDDIKLYTERPAENTHVAVISFSHKRIASEEFGQMLSERGVAVRAGFHCAADAHKKFGTDSLGTVRLSPSYFNSLHEIDIASAQIEAITVECLKKSL